jgi:hypothetical protein
VTYEFDPQEIEHDEDLVLHDNEVLHDDLVPDEDLVLHENEVLHDDLVPDEDLVLHENEVLHDELVPDEDLVLHENEVLHDELVPDEDLVPHDNKVPHDDFVPRDDDDLVPNNDPAPEYNPPLPYHYTIERRKQPVINVEELVQTAILEKIKNTMEYILLLKNATPEDRIAKFSDDALARLHHPPNEPIRIANPGTRQSISMYLALEHASQEAYNRIRRATMQNFLGAEGADEILSFHNVEKLIAQYTGVKPIVHDMCLQSCLAFTGPYADEDHCPLCGTSRWDQAKIHASNGRVKVAAQTFTTIPLGLQLQALYRDPESACSMCYLYERTQEILAEFRETGTIPIIDDIAMGYDYLGAVVDGDIKENDIVLMVSLDGAQL